MRKLRWFVVLLPLLGAGAVPAVTTGCVDYGLGPSSCRKAGEECGFFVGSCCDGLACSDAGARLTYQGP